MTGAVTVGFVAVFGGFGLLAAPAADAVARRLPWVSVGIGLTLMVVGGWLLAGRRLPTVTPPDRHRAAGHPPDRIHGIVRSSYAIASLGCTIGRFLAVVVAGSRTDSVASGSAFSSHTPPAWGYSSAHAGFAQVSATARCSRRPRTSSPGIHRQPE